MWFIKTTNNIARMKAPWRRGRAGLLGLLAAAGCTSAVASELPKVVVLPAQATVFVLGWKAVPHAEWTDTAHDTLSAVWDEATRGSTEFVPVSPGPLSEAEAAEVTEFSRLAIELAYEDDDWGYFPAAKPQRALQLEPLGPSLAFLADRT